jgi:hypothetical protein
MKNEYEDESFDSVSSTWDSECGRLYAQVIHKEVFDIKKYHKMFKTKEYY